MPAFTFEKITPPAELEAGGPTSPTIQRGVLARFVDRLTPARVKPSRDDAGKAEAPPKDK